MSSASSATGSCPDPFVNVSYPYEREVEEEPPTGLGGRRLMGNAPELGKRAPVDETVTLIGIDAATVPTKVGLARGYLAGTTVVVSEAQAGSLAPGTREVVHGWLQDSTRYVLAIDAPLGWPDPLRDALPRHIAATSLPESANDYFLRTTDLLVREKLRLPGPLSVGADRIARTAHWALGFLREVGLSDALLWDPTKPDSGVIEVYPVATLEGWQARSSRKYLKDVGLTLANLESAGAVSVPDNLRSSVLRNEHLFDATLCALAAADFVRGLCLEPTDHEKAVREGWIWFRKPPLVDVTARRAGLS